MLTRGQASPPFNSNRDYNVIFGDESGKTSDAQLLAFKDTWHAWSIGRGELGGRDPVLGDNTERGDELRHDVQRVDTGEGHAGLIGLRSSADVDVV